MTTSHRYLSAVVLLGALTMAWNSPVCSPDESECNAEVGPLTIPAGGSAEFGMMTPQSDNGNCWMFGGVTVDPPELEQPYYTYRVNGMCVSQQDLGALPGGTELTVEIPNNGESDIDATVTIYGSHPVNAPCPPM